MGIYYAESNQETSKELFNKRSIYNGELAGTSRDYANLVDFNFAEKLLYGRVNRLFVPIVLGTIPLRPFNKNASAAKNLSAANFVVDAFNDLAQQFKKCAAAGQITSDDRYLSNLLVYKAYEDPDYLYNQYLTTYYDTLAIEFQRRNIRVKNFDEFLMELETLIEAAASRFPFTLPAYIKSHLCPMTCSGLAVEIADLEYANDEEKVNQFINSPNWEFYLNACRSYGFMVDRNIPWRLVADIGSSEMIQYATKRGYVSTSTILSVGYTKAHSLYYRKFKFLLLNLYNKVKLPNFLVTEDCGGRMQSHVVVPQSYTPAQINNNFSDVQFLKLYFKIRFWEEESQFAPFEQEILSDDTIEIYHHTDVNTALGVFERILNKTFDYRGSLSYIREYLAKNAQGTPSTTTGVGY